MEREMTMVERVARALCIDAGERPDTPTPFNPNADYIWQFYRKSAIAAIGEMREPNLAMRKVCSIRTAELEYPAMIDAALKEHERKPE